MFWDNVAGADFKRQFTAESYRQFFVDAGYPDVRVSPADWGFTHLPDIHPERAADLGCGGRNAGELPVIFPAVSAPAACICTLF